MNSTIRQFRRHLPQLDNKFIRWPISTNTHTNSKTRIQILKHAYKVQYTHTNSKPRIQIVIHAYKFQYTDTNSNTRIQIPIHAYIYEYTYTNSNKNTQIPTHAYKKKVVKKPDLHNVSHSNDHKECGR